MGNNVTYIEPTWAFLPKQLQALDSIDKKEFTLYSGAVGAGKTLLLAHAAIRTCINNPRCKGIIGSLTYTQLKNVVFTVFKEELWKYQDLLNKNGIPVTLIKAKSESHGKMEVTFFNDSKIYFLSMEKEEKIRGYTIDFFMLDEPIEIDDTCFDQLIARKRGQVLPHTFGLLTTNPGAQTHWLYKRFYKTTSENYHHIDTNTYDNVFLKDSYIKGMEEAYDADWIKRFLKGHWGAFEGQIYKAFNLEKHIGDYQNIEFKYYLAGVDWGNRNPSCILTLGVTKDREVCVVNEYYAARKTSKEVADKMKMLDKMYEYKRIFVDPSTPDLILQMRQQHLPAQKGDNHVEDGIGKVRSLFERDQIHVDKSCKNLILELQSYRYDRNQTGKNENERPLKKDDHSCDALRYGIYTSKVFKRSASYGVVNTRLWNLLG